MEQTQLPEMLTTSICKLREGELLLGNEIAALLKVLASCELREGGPYALPGEKVPHLELNQQAAAFLGFFNVHLPNVDTFLHSAKENDDSYHILWRIRDLLKDDLAEFPPEIANQVFGFFEQIIARDADGQITRLAYFIRRALGENGNAFSDEEVAHLGFMNVLVWAAATIYDDFWDKDEAADPRLLPIANRCAREFYEYFSYVFAEHDDAEFIKECMKRMDLANAWETSSCRMKVTKWSVEIPEQLPDYQNYENKFYPIIPHIFGPVSMLLQLGYHTDSKEIRAVVDFFKHYFIAMQLNDDLHDWKEDLARGHISSVVREMLEVWKEETGREQIYLKQDMERLEQMYWFTVLIPICEQILAHCEQSRKVLVSIELFQNIDELEKFILRSERAARKAIHECMQSQEFLSALQQSQ